jgi:hypothetical protein
MGQFLEGGRIGVSSSSLYPPSEEDEGEGVIAVEAD